MMFTDIRDCIQWLYLNRLLEKYASDSEIEFTLQTLSGCGLNS